MNETKSKVMVHRKMQCVVVSVSVSISRGRGLIGKSFSTAKVLPLHSGPPQRTIALMKDIDYRWRAVFGPLAARSVTTATTGCRYVVSDRLRRKRLPAQRMMAALYDRYDRYFINRREVEEGMVVETKRNEGILRGMGELVLGHQSNR